MRAVRFHDTGGPEVLRIDEIEAPEPGPGEVRVAVRFAGVNFIDVYHRTGLYSVGDLPAIPGKEGSGTVEQLGAGVTGFRLGDRIAFVDASGAYAESVALPADKLLRMPAELTFEQAAALPLQGMTADYLVRTIGAVKAGDSILIHAAAGGVGLLAVQMAKRAGARVFGTCSTPEKAERARAAGCDHSILYTEVDFAETVLRATGGRGCDVVLDSVGRTTFKGSVRSTRERGVLCVFGQSSGLIEPFSPRPVLGSRTLVSASLFDYIRDPKERAERWRRVAGEAARGELEVTLDRVHPLEEAGLAHRRLEGRETSGKLLLGLRGAGSAAQPST